MIRATPEFCHECDVRMLFDVEALVIYCPNACGNEYFIGVDLDYEYDWNDHLGG